MYVLPGFSPRQPITSASVNSPYGHPVGIQRAEPKPASEARSFRVKSDPEYKFLCNLQYHYFFRRESFISAILRPSCPCCVLSSPPDPVQPANERVFLCQRAAAIDPNERAGSRHFRSFKICTSFHSSGRGVQSTALQKPAEHRSECRSVFHTVMFNQASESKEQTHNYVKN